jgi:hypothetical protein
MTTGLLVTHNIVETLIAHCKYGVIRIFAVAKELINLDGV